MRIALRGAMIVTIATLALLGAVTPVAARLIGADDADFTIRWIPLAWIAGGTTTTCNVTLTGSFHSAAFPKSSGPVIGYITRASINSCNSGAGGTVLAETLPWHVQYAAFEGSLPSISAVTLTISGSGMQFDPAGALPACLFRTDAAEPFRGIANLNASGQVTAFTADRSQSIDIEDDRFLCSIGGDSEFEGAGAVEDSAGSSLHLFLSDASSGDLSEPSPANVILPREEVSDTFTLRNHGALAVTIDRVSDLSAVQFDVAGCGARTTLAVGASCVYTVQVDERPLESGRVIIEYDDGLGVTRRVTVEVDITGDDTEARLIAEPSAVMIEQLEQNDIVEVRNIGGGLEARVDGVTTTTSDSERPDFAVTTTGCSERLAVNEACHYLISVNFRPETSGSITVEYDDGTGANRRLVIEVDIAGPDPAELEAAPREVTIERLESNDSFVIRNVSPDTAAVVDRPTLASDDSITPEFSVNGIGCPSIYVPGASCTYIVSVNSRPETDGRYTLEYDDGAGSTRTVAVDIDIAS